MSATYRVDRVTTHDWNGCSVQPLTAYMSQSEAASLAAEWNLTAPEGVTYVLYQSRRRYRRA